MVGAGSVRVGFWELVEHSVLSRVQVIAEPGDTKNKHFLQEWYFYSSDSVAGRDKVSESLLSYRRHLAFKINLVLDWGCVKVMLFALW